MSAALMELVDFPQTAPWLGRIPAHWACVPARSLFREIKEQGFEGEELLSVTIGRGVIRQAELLANSSKKDSSNLDKSKYKLACPGDIVYNKMRAWQGSIGLSKYRGIVSPAYIVQRLRGEAEPRYFHYLFRTPAFAAEAQRWSYGITSDQWSLRPEQFKMIYIPVPPGEEQRQIVRYIDHLELVVTRFIRNKLALIALLTEEVSELIDLEIRTAGQPASSLRASGVRWISELPVTWEVKRLQHLLDPSVPLAYGILLPGPRLDEGAPYIGAGDVKPDRLRLELLPRTTQEIADAYPRTRMRAGDLAYAIRGSFGRVEVIGADLEGVNLSRDAARLAPRKGIVPQWLAWALRSGICQQQFDFREIGATITGVNIRDLKRVVLPVPPTTEEQEEIVRRIERSTAPLRRAIETAQREIDLIREYRTALVADVVTGRFDTRGVTPDPGHEEGLEDPLEALDGVELENEALEVLADELEASGEVAE